MNPTNEMTNAPVDTTPKTLRITEIYTSVQGESTWAGLPCTFIRLARCPLRCVWCDTAYAFYGGEKLSLSEILEAVRARKCSLVEITGGEPLVQPECPDLARSLIDAGYTVLVETSGSLPIDVLPHQTIRIMDLKCPDSGECDKNHWPNVDALTPQDEVKFVIAGRQDYEWARKTTRDYRLTDRCNSVLFSPVHGSANPRDLVQWILDDELEVRFQLQLHKYIWPPDKRGV